MKKNHLELDYYLKQNTSVYSVFQAVAQQYPRNPALIWKNSDSYWQKLSYQNTLKKIKQLAKNLLALGVLPQEKIAILSHNRPEWAITDLALNKIKAISVPLHSTAKFDQIQYILKKTETKILFIDEKSFLEHLTFLKKEKNLEKVIIFKEDNHQITKKSLPLEEKILFFDDLIKSNFTPKSKLLGPSLQEEKDEKKPKDVIASIIYTSGTTGEPKGAILTNQNFLSNIWQVKQTVKIFPNDLFLSFLPLSHVLERTAGSYIPLSSGSAIAYAESIHTLKENIQEINPTVIVAVPKIFERAFEKIFAKAKNGSSLTKKIFFWGLKNHQNYFQKKLAKLFVLDKIKRQVLGKKIRFAVSGGASLLSEINKFFKHIGINIVEGYGLTETSPILTVNPLKKIIIGSVGQPLPKVQIKINPDKEILVKGPNVFLGYYKKTQLNQEIFDNKGFFKTGDLGFLDQDKYLTIIGRKKDIIVTSNGKNIAPEKLENLINLSPFVEQSLVVGHKRKFLASLITVPKETLSATTLKDIKKEIEKYLQEKNKTLPPYEHIKKFTILQESFSLEKSELTATLKLRRKFIEEKYRKTIDKMYQEN